MPTIELDERMRDVLGDPLYYKNFMKLFVHECKTSGVTQVITTERLNSVLRCYGKDPVHESTVKRLWN